MKKRKLLFISAYTASFVKNDLNFLQKHFSVRELIFSGGKNPLEIIKTVFLIFREILRNEIVYCWFADFRAFVAVFLAKLFGKKSIFKFILVGKFMDDSIEYLRSIAAENVEFTGFVEFEKLSEFYQKAKVYVQVSAHEAFGLSLAEAMLCECVPVVTRRGAIPEVAGENGFYVDFDNPQKTAAAILQAMNSEKGKEARQHILKNFCLKEREEKIVKAINEIL
ncbi:MAG: hypothetical protein B6D62_00865 [Candidatus Cloacimonas sp. 4484_275]|nr:MAG: hypothetical protein B6D62_00865 [Candidatus Cloacimonas sp. 4484_275]